MYMVCVVLGAGKSEDAPSLSLRRQLRFMLRHAVLERSALRCKHGGCVASREIVYGDDTMRERRYRFNTQSGRSSKLGAQPHLITATQARADS